MPEPAEDYGMCIKCKELIPLSQVAPIEKTKDYLCLECIKKMKELEPEEKIEVGRDEIFIKHIESHIDLGEEVICIFCKKTAREIINEFRKHPQAERGE